MIQTAIAIRRRVIGLFAGVSLAALLAGCAGVSQNESTGAILGGAAGAVLGNQFGDGDGRVVMTALGAILGATVGQEIGASLDETSRTEAALATQRALDSADVGGTGITWDNPANSGGPASGTTVITRQGANQQGRTCREFQQTVTIGGEEVQSYGTACRDGNGDWRLVSG